MKTGIYNEIHRLIADALPYDESNPEKYYKEIDDLHDKIMALIPSKISLSGTLFPLSNKPLWLWLKGIKLPILANFRTDYPTPCFWEIVDGDYINNSNSIPLEKCTHFMYVNEPDPD